MKNGRLNPSLLYQHISIVSISKLNKKRTLENYKFLDDVLMKKPTNPKKIKFEN